MTDAKAELSQGGKLKKVRIVLDEASGPVSPRYQYELKVVLSGDDGGITLEHTQEGDGAGDADAKIELKRPVPPEVYQAFMTELLDAGALEQGGDLVGQEGKKREGVSANYLSIELGDARMRLDYLGPTLKRDEHQARRKLVELVKTLKDRLPPALSPQRARGARAPTTRRVMHFDRGKTGHSR